MVTDGSDDEGPRQAGAKKSRRNKKAAGKDGYDSDEEREKAHRMFSDDLQDLRRLFLQIMNEQVKT